MEIWKYLALFGAALAGGILAFIMRRSNPRILKLIMALTGAFIFGITLVHLLPELYESEEQYIGAFILLGFFLQIAIEHLSHGIEHGHVHVPHGGASTGFAISIFIGLAVHCFMEGMPIAGMKELGEHAHNGVAEVHEHNHAHEYILFGVMSHKAPAAFALVLILLQSGFSRLTTALFLIMYAAMSPLGAATASWLGSADIIGGRAFTLIMALVVGSFLHISTTILFESEEHHHQFSWQKSLAVLAGFLLSLVSF